MRRRRIHLPRGIRVTQLGRDSAYLGAEPNYLPQTPRKLDSNHHEARSEGRDVP